MIILTSRKNIYFRDLQVQVPTKMKSQYSRNLPVKINMQESKLASSVLAKQIAEGPLTEFCF